MFESMRPWFPALLLSSTLVGCSSGGPAAGDGGGVGGGDLGSPSDLAAGADLQASGDGAVPNDFAVGGSYPAGPYGRMKGDTFPLLAWEGYVNPTASSLSTSQPYGPYSMDDARRSGRSYGLVHVSEFF
jgi:hypothetical protein